MKTETTPKPAASSDNDQLARQCLKLIAEIANRGSRSQDPQQIGYALQELTQVLFERTGNDDRVFEPVAPSEISDLHKLYRELDWINCSAQSMAASARRN